jgi:hypothetical protein
MEMFDPSSHAFVRKLRLHPVMYKPLVTGLIIAFNQDDAGSETMHRQRLPDKRDAHLAFKQDRLPGCYDRHQSLDPLERESSLPGSAGLMARPIACHDFGGRDPN